VHVMNSAIKRRPKPRIKSKNKSYTLKDSALFKLTTKRRLVELLGRSISELKAFSADTNYRIFHLEKPGKCREIQAPTFELDVVQTRIASLLVRVATPEYLHSGIKGRSNITNAAAHIGDHPVLTMDIQQFYPSVTKKSIFHFFNHTMQVAPDVAGILAELCSYDGHIPTGSRISMPLSFWANYAMYSRIHSLCLCKEVNMTIFVDDLTFSGANVNKLFRRNIENIIRSARLTVHPKKTILYGRRKPKLVTGAVVDQNGMRVRNKHHKAIYTSFLELAECTNDEQLETIQKQLIGRLNAAGQIEPAFRQRAKQFCIESGVNNTET